MRIVDASARPHGDGADLLTAVLQAFGQRAVPAVAAILGAWGTFGGDGNSTGDYIFVLVIIGVLALAVAFLFVQHYVLPRKAADVGGTISDKSVAVLPFENLSDEKSSAYFASGIQDEILTRLAKIGALKVISRTSTQHYASSPANLPEIARQLGVANILEGSVQKAGDAVHINVQLIHAAWITY